MDWLKQEPKGFKLVKFIMSMASMGLIVAILIGTIMLGLGVEITKPTNNIKILSISFPFIILAVVMIEEFIFRLIPLVLALKIGYDIKETAVVVLLVSAFFGYLHGGVEHVFIQGSSGIVFSVVFLKCGAMNKSYGKAYLCSTACHYIHNMIIFLSAVIVGLEKF